MDVGQTVRVTAEWKANGALTNPGTVTAKAIDPDGDVTDLTVMNDTTGKNHADLELTKAGRWWVRFEGTDPVPTADEIAIEVERTAFPPVVTP